MTNMAAKPIYNKNPLKNLLLQHQEADYFETCYVASCKRVLPNLFKLKHWVDPDVFYAKVNYGH